MRMTRKKLIAALSAAVLVVALATAAFAYWTTSGTGSGTGSTAAGTADQLSFATTSITNMFPGDSAQPFTVTVTNNSSQTATVSHVKAYVTTSNALCDGSNFLLNNAAAPSNALSAVDLGWTQTDIAAAGSHATSGLDTIQFNNKLTPQDDCKNVVVTVNYVAS